jgi:hypothetical protein
MPQLDENISNGKKRERVKNALKKLRKIQCFFRFSFLKWFSFEEAFHERV